MVTAYESLVWSVDTSFEIVWRQIWWSVATSCDSILVERSLVECKNQLLKQSLVECGDKLCQHVDTSLVECGDKLCQHVETSMWSVEISFDMWGQVWLSVEISLAVCGDKPG